LTTDFCDKPTARFIKRFIAGDSRTETHTEIDTGDKP
jgi:hypothetical protein